MKIAVVAANGKAGKLIVAEALSRGLDVTAIVRGENKSAAKKFITKEIMALTKDDLKAQAAELAELRKRNDVKWTFVSPAADFQPDGKRTGKYILAGEEFTLNSKNESVLSYADYAIAMIDEATKGNHIQERISVIGE